MAHEVTDGQKGRPSGKVRAARLTDLPALGELSRIAQTEGSGSRTLGLPVNGPPIGVFSLFRLPLVAFRPHDLLFVYELDRHVSGLVRVERENWRDEWTIVELDAIGPSDPARSRSSRPGVQRLEGFRIPDWERQGSNWRVPRSSLAPILRFADIDGFVQESADGVQLDGFIQTGVAREDQPHYLRLLGTGRPSTRGVRLRGDRHGHTAHEGDPRSRRGTQPRPGGRSSPGGHPWLLNRRPSVATPRSAARRLTTSGCCWRRCRPRSSQQSMP
jgi:hypothetical protein